MISECIKYSLSDNDAIQIKIKKNKIKNMYLKATLSGITAIIPDKSDSLTTHNFLEKNKNWLIKMVYRYRNILHDYAKIYYNSKLIFYRGKLYTLHLIKDKTNFVTISDNLKKITFHAINIKTFKKKIKEWYKEETITILSHKIPLINQNLSVSYNKINVKYLKSKWGSCSNKRNLNFHYLLSSLPDNLINYIIIHELTHILEFNHSKNFWKLVKLNDPFYKEHINLLKIYNDILNL